MRKYRFETVLGAVCVARIVQHGVQGIYNACFEEAAQKACSYEP